MSSLKLLKDNVAASLKAIPIPDAHEESGEAPPYVLVFAGHRIDSQTREEPRFPANKEDEARRAIKGVVEKELGRVKGKLVGFAGGASGGDILFHEVCAE